jgi:hypothetical protein
MDHIHRINGATPYIKTGMEMLSRNKIILKAKNQMV